MSIYKDLCDVAGDRYVLENEPMSAHTTFRVGGPARYMAMVSSAEAAAAYIRIAMREEIPYTVVGNGSNLLVSDTGYKGLVLLVGNAISEIKLDGTTITAGAGATLGAIARVAKEASLTGFEFAAGIPGTLGGACLMNAGAYGGEMKQVLKTVTTVTKDGALHEYPIEELDLSYRHSALMDREEVIVEATLELQQGVMSEIVALMEDLAGRRRDKQPLEYPSAGSTFKRPEGYFAGALIEEAGLKGKGIGGACVSEKHAGFVINKSNATAADIYETILMVQNTVKERSGIVLEPEVRMLGFENA